MLLWEVYKLVVQLFQQRVHRCFYVSAKDAHSEEVKKKKQEP